MFPCLFQVLFISPRGLRFTKMLIFLRKTCIFCRASNARPFVFHHLVSMCFHVCFHNCFLFFDVFWKVFGRNVGAFWMLFHAWKCKFLRNMSGFGAQSPSISFAHFLMYCFHFFACFSSLAHHFTSLDRGWHVNSGWHVEIKPPALRYKNRLWNYLCRRPFDTKIGSGITYAGPSSVRTATRVDHLPFVPEPSPVRMLVSPPLCDE